MSQSHSLISKLKIHALRFVINYCQSQLGLPKQKVLIDCTNAPITPGNSGTHERKIVIGRDYIHTYERFSEIGRFNDFNAFMRSWLSREIQEGVYSWVNDDPEYKKRNVLRKDSENAVEHLTWQALKIREGFNLFFHRLDVALNSLPTKFVKLLIVGRRRCSSIPSHQALIGTWIPQNQENRYIFDDKSFTRYDADQPKQFSYHILERWDRYLRIETMFEANGSRNEAVFYFFDDYKTLEYRTGSSREIWQRQVLSPGESEQNNSASAAFMRALEEKRKSDPLIGAKIGGKEVFSRLLNAMKDPRGVHIDSLLCALGALAGYSCQASLRAESIAKGQSETAAFVVIDTANGKKFFFGDSLNGLVAESQLSIWGLAAGAAEKHGCNSLPNVSEIFSYVTASLGQTEFGTPRFPDGHNAGDSPISYVKVLWPTLLPVVKQFCIYPAEWPILFGIAIQEAIEMSKTTIEPCIALQIVMESAIPMSKVDLEAY